MPKYKLIYFNSRGAGEVARLIFAQAGQEYIDERLSREEWGKIKPDAPFGQLPLLEVDGTVICQSEALSRYLARQFGLAGSSPLDEARCDMIINCIQDALKPLTAWYYEKDEAKKAELAKKYEEEQLPGYLSYLEKMLTARQGGDAFFTGDQVTWADIYFFQNITWVEMAKMKVEWEKFPKLSALRERVEKLPRITAWLQKRPKTDM